MSSAPRVRLEHSEYETDADARIYGFSQLRRIAARPPEEAADDLVGLRIADGNGKSAKIAASDPAEIVGAETIASKPISRE